MPFAQSCQQCCIPSNVHQRRNAPVVINTSTSANVGDSLLHSHPLQYAFYGGDNFAFAHYLYHWSQALQISTRREITTGNTYFSTGEIFADFTG